MSDGFTNPDRLPTMRGGFEDAGSHWGLDPDLTLLGTNRRPAPNFPVQLLGPFWADWARRSAENSAAPVDYAAGALIATVAATMANVRWPVAGAGWQEPPHLWIGLVGSPSSGKSPAMESAFSLVRHAEDHLAAGFDAELKAYEANKYIAASHLKAWQAETDAAVKGGLPPPEKPLAAEEPQQPVRPRIQVADATTEKLGVLSAALPRGLLLARDELAGWVASFDRYGGSGTDRAFFLEAYGGRSYRIDRMRNAEPVNIRHLSVGVLGTTQPDRLSAITGGADDGLASRVLWVWPDTIPTFRLAREIHDDTAAKYAFNRLLLLQLGTDTFGNPEPIRLRLTSDGSDAIEAFGQEIAAKVEEASGSFAGALGKCRGQVLRLAAVLEHLWWCADGQAPEPSSISTRAVMSAAGMVQSYFIGMAERVYGDASIPKGDRAAMALARYLRRNSMRTFNARTAGREIGGDLRNPELMAEATKRLVEDGLIRLRPRGNATGRPAKDFEVHPVVSART